MKTLKNILAENSLTELEVTVLIALNYELRGNFGELYSHVDTADLAEATNNSKPTIKGVLSSLQKKGIVVCDIYEDGSNLVGFVGQDEMEYFNPLAA